MPGVVLTGKYLTGADNRESTGNILRKLIEYTESHFKMEEDMLQEHDYPYFSSHAASHKKLLHRVLMFKNMYEHGALGIESEILCFVKGRAMLVRIFY